MALLCFRNVINYENFPKMNRETMISLLMLYFMTFCVIFPILFHTVPHTLYFRNESSANIYSEALTANDHRILRSQFALQNFNDGRFAVPWFNYTGAQATKRPDVVIAIVALSRLVNNYNGRFLTQGLAQFYKTLNEYNKRTDHFNIKLFICNVDPDPVNFSELEDLSPIAFVISRHQSRYFSFDHVLEIEKKDYVFCMKSALSLGNPRYVMVVEDDAVPIDDFFEILHFTIRHHLDSNYGRDLTNEPAFVKFYHPDRLLTFFSDFQRLVELLFLVLVFLFAVVGMCWILKLTNHKNSNQVLAILALYFALFFIVIGRPNINRLRSISPYLYLYEPAPSCCTQALLFPPAAANDVIDFMNSKTCKKYYGKDSILDDYVQFTRRKAYFVEPSTFQHVGFFSILRHRFVSPDLL